MGSRTYSFDAKMLAVDGAVAYTASGPGLVGGVQKIIDFGGAPRRTDLGIVGGMARIDLALIIDVSALNVANANNVYRVNVVGTNNPATLAGGQRLGSIALGNTGAMSAGEATSIPGRYELMVSTEQADINYEYVGVYVDAAGTAPSIALTAFFAPLPEI